MYFRGLSLHVFCGILRYGPLQYSCNIIIDNVYPYKKCCEVWLFPFADGELRHKELIVSFTKEFRLVHNKCSQAPKCRSHSTLGVEFSTPSQEYLLIIFLMGTDQHLQLRFCS